MHGKGTLVAKGYDSSSFHDSSILRLRFKVGRAARPTGTTCCQRVAVGYLTRIMKPRFMIRPVPLAETDTFQPFGRFVGIGTPVTVNVWPAMGGRTTKNVGIPENTPSVSANRNFSLGFAVS